MTIACVWLSMRSVSIFLYSTNVSTKPLQLPSNESLMIAGDPEKYLLLQQSFDDKWL